MKTKKITAAITTGCLVFSMCASLQGCGSASKKEKTTKAETATDREKIEEALNLKNMDSQKWRYDSDADAWVMSVVTAVTKPQIEDEQGVSVCVPGAYVKGLDTDSDGKADKKAAKVSKKTAGSLVLNKKAKVTSTNGQEYTAATAPIIFNTGAAGYSSSTNTEAATTYAKEGYINVSCGNRGKQDTIEDAKGNTKYTGDAPCCLVDQKNAIRFVKYNILLGNLPGDVDRVVSTGGSGGGAHATMFAATADSSDFYDYQIDAGAVGIYKDENGDYITTVLVDDREQVLSDGAWGCMAYSPITSLKEADMAMAFEYYLDKSYDFGSDFQKKLAGYLSKSYMNYINDQNLGVDEKAVGLDIDGNGRIEDEIALVIEYDEDDYKDTNGYGGTYTDFYLAEFVSNLQWYLDNLDYAKDWTWFDKNGKALSDKKVKKMTSEDRAKAFLEGRYAKGSSGEKGEMKGAPGGAKDGAAGNGGEKKGPDGEGSGAKPPTDNGDTMEAGTPDEGTTQSASGGTDSSNYESYMDMIEEYQSDIDEITDGDAHGNNIVDLYDPLRYIGSKGVTKPAWARLLMGAAEGDMSMMSSLNLQIKFLEAGTDCRIDWQWDGGHVPSEIFGDSLPLYVDQMYGKYVEGAKEIEKPEPSKQKKNGSEKEPCETDISSWVDSKDINKVSFTLKDAAKYRTAGAVKAVPGFDVIDYGQEDYVFGSSKKDARHWDKTLLGILKEQQESLEKLFNK